MFIGGVISGRACFLEFCFLLLPQLPGLLRVPRGG